MDIHQAVGTQDYKALKLSFQRRSTSLSLSGNYTLSRCMTDPATTELTGPTTVDPNNPDLDYSYCASDRRHIINLSAVARTPDFASGAKRVLLSGWQFSPIVRWQSGNPFSLLSNRQTISRRGAWTSS